MVVAQSSYEGSLPRTKVDVDENEHKIDKSDVNKPEVVEEDVAEKDSEENQKSKKFFLFC